MNSTWYVVTSTLHTELWHNNELKKRILINIDLQVHRTICAFRCVSYFSVLLLVFFLVKNFHIVEGFSASLNWFVVKSLFFDYYMLTEQEILGKDKNNKKSFKKKKHNTGVEATTMWIMWVVYPSECLNCYLKPFFFFII